MTVARDRVRRAAVPALLAAALLVPAALAPAGAASGSPVVVPPVPTQVLAPVAVSAGSAPAAADAALAARVTAALAVKAVGADTAASVLDVDSGTAVLATGATRPQLPASTLKILTGMAVLHALGGQTRLRTTVVSGATSADIVLVGAGDATLTRSADARTWPAGQSARPASIAALAASTVAALKKAGRTTVAVHVDDSLFTGPRTAPGWPASFTGTGVVAPVSALSVDQGRSGPGTGSGARVADPALAAGTVLAARLKAAGIRVTGAVTRVVAPASATELAAVSSPTVTDLVERMMTQSDDDLAEALAHLAGGKLGGAASFAGGATATLATLADLGVTSTGAVLVDGSGLSGLDRLTAATLVAALAELARPTRPAADALWPVVTGLPVAGATGTLADRFTVSGTAAGRGVVLAKTGTLTGVNALAGLVRDRTGRLRAFAFIGDGSPGPQDLARAALDRAATAVATA